jgi:ornithine cyclodeaminase/alanine dehydrogenase-like protein (mu-crystallin family)
MLHVLPSIERVRLHDLRMESARDLGAEAATWTRSPIELTASPESCLRGADVAATCTSGRMEVQDNWFPLGGTAVGVDSHVAWSGLFGKVKLIMDDEQQAREFEKQGKYPGGLPPVHAELGQILLGTRPGREVDDEWVLGLPLGLAIADLAVARLVWETFSGQAKQ